MKHYDFNTPFDRRHTDCVKYDLLPHLYGRDDLLPLWVADTDFPSPSCVLDALRRRLDHPFLGYPMPSASYWESLCQWLLRHYRISTSPQELHFIPGIVAGISYTLLCLTQPGDRVLTLAPVYPPFFRIPRGCGREVEASPLQVHDGRFVIDFDDFERRAQGCRLFILANPHNPAGTLWNSEDLKRIADICHQAGLIVVADEIHADLTLPGHHHTSYSTVSPSAADHSITFFAPSKTFNIAGLASSACYIPNPDLRSRFFAWLDALGVASGSLFAFVGAEAAYTGGEDYLRQLLPYLEANIALLRTFLASRMPSVRALLPEASYLAWLDFSACGYSHSQLTDLIINRARLVLNDGTEFGGSTYECCFRLNLACPRAVLADALDRLADALLPFPAAAPSPSAARP
ncbi:MAG: PatB family C-S lyase [Bacteroidales bacterium]|nr:PatB family C-S lyase [Bacteroidales bacterium]